MGLPWLFTAVQMHLHWGSGGPSHGGSEHTINGLSADAEVCFDIADGKQEKARPVIAELGCGLGERWSCKKLVETSCLLRRSGFL